MDYLERYEFWRAHAPLTAAERGELDRMASDDDALKGAFGAELAFGTAGIRGIMGLGTNRLNDYTVRRTAQGLAAWLTSTELPQKCAIGYDSRHNSRRYAEICATALAEKGVEMLDAPVSGGEPKAVDGTLSFMCGGSKALFDKYQDLLKVMGASVVHCGDVNGAGNTVKLANQIIVAVNIAACAEAYSLSTMCGVDPAKVFAAIRGGLAGSTVMDAKVPMMMEGNFKPGFKIDLHIKDLNNALDTGHGLGTPMLLTAQVQEMLQWLHNHDCGQCDHSAILKFYEQITGVEVRKEK